MTVLEKIGADQRAIFRELPKLMRDINGERGYSHKIKYIEEYYKEWTLLNKLALAYCIGKFSGAEATLDDPIHNERALKQALYLGDKMTDAQIDEIIDNIYQEDERETKE